MGGSASCALDDAKCAYIRGRTEAVIKNFSPHYRRQYAVAFCKHVQNELEQHRDSQSQFLKTKPPVEAGTVLYETEVLHFAEDLKKWKDRYVVIQSDYTVDCFETKEAYQKGVSPKYHILPAGGKVLTSEEDYNLLSDKHFPDPVGCNEKEGAQAFVQLPKEFPVYLWQPYFRHSYYCFPEPKAQQQFSAVLSDCVRHSNHGSLLRRTVICAVLGGGWSLVCPLQTTAGVSSLLFPRLKRLSVPFSWFGSSIPDQRAGACLSLSAWTLLKGFITVMLPPEKDAPRKGKHSLGLGLKLAVPHGENWHDIAVAVAKSGPAGFASHPVIRPPEEGAQLRARKTYFLKQTTYEVEAFLEAIQFFRQEKGHYGTWEMITGNEKQILSNLVMEELLPNLQTMILPKMKGKRNDRKRAWFGIVEETYSLVQQQVSEGLSTLKEECRDFAKTLEGTIRSDMDQILNSKNFLAGKIKATVSEPAQKCCTENIQPFLTSILEELMGPVSSGFTEVRSLFDKEVNEIIQNFQKTNDTTNLKENVDQLMKLPFNSVKMEPCYLKVNLLEELLQDLKSRFKVYHIDFVLQRTQNFMQELMENAVYTFEQLFSPSRQADSAKIATTIEKVKLRVLKQYDYDSSTIRKKIFQEALIQITLPTMQRTLASTCKPELQKYEQFIFADYTSVIQVENVYEEILHQMLLEETLKVIKEAAILKKHNLFEDNLNLPCESVSSLTDLKTPSGSAQTTPAKQPSTTRAEISDAETQSEETLIVTEKNSCEKDRGDGKSLDREAVVTVKMADNQASTREKVIITDISEKQDSPPYSPQKQEAAEEKITSQNEDKEKAEFVETPENELKTPEGAVEEKVTFETETTVQVDFGANTETEYKVHEETMEQTVTSGSKKATETKFLGNVEEESKVRKEVAEAKLTSPHDNIVEAEMLGNVDKKTQVEEETVGELPQGEKAVGLGEDSKKESKNQGEVAEDRVSSQSENAVKEGFGDMTKKTSQSEEKSVKPPDDVNEIRSLLMVAVELPADTSCENMTEICKCETSKLQEHDNGCNEVSKVIAAESQGSHLINKDAECTELKRDQLSPSSAETNSTNLMIVSGRACNMAQAEWLVDISSTSQEVKTETENNQSVLCTGMGSCESNRLQPEEHTENVTEDERLDVEEGGAMNSHTAPVEVGTESFYPNPAEYSDITQDPRTEAMDVPVPSAPELGNVSTVQVTGDAWSGESEGKPPDESSAHAEINSTEGREIFTEENREDSSVLQNSEE